MQKQAEVGAVSALTLETASGERDRIRAALPDVQDRRDRAESALSLLLGHSPQEIVDGAPERGKSDKSNLTSFNAADLNGDGKISPEKFAIAVRRILAIRDDFSSRGFGLLSKSTQDQVLKAHFDEMDRSKKGFLLPDDWKDNR